MVMSPDFEITVVGAGVVGLATAYQLARSGHNVLVLERNARVGSETSSRNSEVIHAGLYYPTGSLKASLCVKGKQMLYQFTSDNGIPHRRVGKLLVATSASDIPKLHRISEQAEKNGVCDLIPLSATEARALEPAIHCKAALLSPSTGIIDSHAFMSSLEAHISSNKGQVVLNATVEEARVLDDGYFSLQVGGQNEATVVTCQKLIIAAGLHCTSLVEALHEKARRLASYKVPQLHFAKGHYFALSGHSPFSHLIYPVPEGAGLGIHLTLDMGGKAKFGPDVAWQDELNYDFEDQDGLRSAHFYREIRRYWPDLPDDSLYPDYTGIRPKLGRECEPAADFAIHDSNVHGISGLVTLHGIESPGLTASLAIAEHVAGCL
jgi:L-2-hydroxyglutarate oxidase LhgO